MNTTRVPLDNLESAQTHEPTPPPTPDHVPSEGTVPVIVGETLISIQFKCFETASSQEI